MKKKHRLPPLDKTERAQSLVEMAISLIVILTLLAGAVDLGIALFSYVALRDAAQEGALYASVSGSDGTNLNCTAIEDRVRSTSSNPVAFILPDGSNNPRVNINICSISADTDPDYKCPNHCNTDTPPCEGSEDLAMVRVEVHYDYPLSMPIIPGILGTDKIPLSASVTDAILNPFCQ